MVEMDIAKQSFALVGGLAIMAPDPATESGDRLERQ